MAVPDFQACMLPLLRFLADGKNRTKREAVEYISRVFSLSDEDRAALIPSGKQSLVANRIGWARTYLAKAGLVQAPKRGIMAITDRGRELLAEKPAAVTMKLLERYPEYQEFRAIRREKATPDTDDPAEEVLKTPEEALQDAYAGIRADVETEILAKVQSCSPGFFERLVVELLVRMGYGGSRLDAGQVIGGSGDAGIDGLIKEDRLGLDLLYVQAKRWKEQVQRPEIQKFAGALQGQRAKKGVFITTSSFSSGAREFAEQIESRIVLIDGRGLARFMVDFNLGVSIANTYEIKKIDHDYFDEDS
jgi:restriction system protein